MITWPGNARCAVAVTFDLDAELFWRRLHPSAADRPKTLSLGEYGITRGTPRLLDLLGEFDVPASWFIPMWTLERHPAAVERVRVRGHEIACRGVADEVLGALEPERQAETIDRAARALEKATGARPRGFRAPPGRVGEEFGGLLAQLGFGWSSTLFGDDIPHYLESGGRSTGVVEVPRRWEHTDYPYFAYNGGPVAFPPGRSRIASHEVVLEEWKAAFDAYHREGLCFVLCLEPQIIGKPGRALLLEELLRHIRSRPGVWFATCGQIAEHFRRHGGENPPEHPERVRATWTRN